MLGLFLALAACTTSAGTSGQSPRSQVESPGPASTSVATPNGGEFPLDIDGRTVLVTPPGVDAGARMGLLVVLHGYTGSASGMVNYFGLRTMAAERGILVAAPQGTADSDGNTFWNASDACCNFQRSDVDDSAFLSEVIATLIEQYPVDPARVYVIGHSNGGFMSFTMACEHADQIAAVASLAGAMDVDTECDPGQPVSALQVHGNADAVVGFTGGLIMGRRFTSAPETVRFWHENNGCEGSGQAGPRLDADSDVAGADLTPTQWEDCRDGTGVALWTIAGANHVPRLTPAFGAVLLDWLESHQRT